MSNIIDYVKEYGKYDFGKKHFSETDALLLSQVAYIKFKGFVPGSDDEAGSVTLSDLDIDNNLPKLLDEYWYKKQNEELLRVMLSSVRFHDMRINYHTDVLDESNEEQFSATTFILNEGTVYVAFRGTDASLVGWKEDFNLAYSHPIAAQKSSVAYLEKIAACTKADLYVGGHSKGGNLAVYSAMYCSDDVRNRIKKVYSFDGPGFRPEIKKESHYAEISSRVSKYIPASSIVGIIMEDENSYNVVDASGMGTFQHNTYNWKINGDRIARKKGRKAHYLLMDDALNTWILGLTQDELHAFTDTLYDVVNASGASSLYDLRDDWTADMKKIAQAVNNLDDDTKKNIYKIVRLLFDTVHNQMKDKAIASYLSGVDEVRNYFTLKS
ncbi:Mbeg1-like protein [Butyrivibrio sp. INlla16]|uniref:Mbeg1-like protein n=1 Tax=Butyrivibrio sp. INlla16 TaxID=1520807 RepID=UPI00147A3B81|nr:Mbeg1-like protein [Butyrivibrio sp. INlla16]